MDMILNGVAHGPVANRLLQNNFDVGIMRPYIGKDGKTYVTINKAGKPTSVCINANATLRKDEWIELDKAVVKAAQNRLRLVDDLRSGGLVHSLGNGMGKTVFQTQTQSDVSPATISMDPVRKGDNDRPEYGLNNLPLPVIHADFSFNARQLATSRNEGSPLDTSMAELKARKVAEAVESLAMGTYGSYAFGGGSIYGLVNFPQRMTKVQMLPTATAWTPAKCVKEVLAMKLQSQLAKHYGPWMLYTSPGWDAYLDDDYSTAKGDNTLRERLKKIEGIKDVRTLDNLTGATYQMVLVSQTSDVIREIVGMDMTTVQWEEQGGLLLNFKIMAIMVPQLRADHNGITGIVHGSSA
jgi:uncharacterized linocin/CFP29 family protein